MSRGGGRGRAEDRGTDPAQAETRAGRGTLGASDGTRLRTLVWQAPMPRGRVVLVHGLGDHAGRFSRLVPALLQRGYSVLAYDQRGHGESEGRRGYVARFGLFVDDLDRAVGEAEETLSGSGRAFLYGHSMGALVVLRYLQAALRDAPGAILSAPWLATVLRIPRWKTALAAVLRRTAPAFPVPTSIAVDHLMQDPELQRLYLSDELVGHAISVALYDAVVDAQQRALREGTGSPIPVLLLLPLADGLVDVARTEAWAEQAGANVEVARLPGMRHEPHHEPDRESVFRLVGDWLDARTSSAGSG